MSARHEHTQDSIGLLVLTILAVQLTCTLQDTYIEYEDCIVNTQGVSKYPLLEQDINELIAHRLNANRLRPERVIQ